MIIVGIDYSLTSPCVCVSRDKTFSTSCFYFLNDRKSVVGKHHNILGEQHDDYLTDQERYENIASWVLSILASFDKEDKCVEQKPLHLLFAVQPSTLHFKKHGLSCCSVIIFTLAPHTHIYKILPHSSSQILSPEMEACPVMDLLQKILIESLSF